MPFFTSYEQAATGPPERWRNLPAEWPHWQAVYYYFDQWKKAGVYQKMNDELNKLDRMNEAREALPSALCADS